MKTWLGRAVPAALIVVIGAALLAPASAHVTDDVDHLYKHLKPMFSRSGRINSRSNPVHWTKLKGVPNAIADGSDDRGVTGVNPQQNSGITGGGNGGQLSLDTDPSVLQRRVSGTCQPGSSVTGINEDGTVTCAGGGIAIDLARGGGGTFAGNTTFTDLTGAQADLVLTTQSQIVIDFSAETACYGAVGTCRVRALVNGAVAGSEVDFDSSDNNTETSSSWESHATQRHSLVLAPGNYNIRIQWSTSSATMNFRMGSWSLSAMAVGT